VLGEKPVPIEVKRTSESPPSERMVHPGGQPDHI
jgi:hypothetical protein